MILPKWNSKCKQTQTRIRTRLNTFSFALHSVSQSVSHPTNFIPKLYTRIQMISVSSRKLYVRGDDVYMWVCCLYERSEVYGWVFLHYFYPICTSHYIVSLENYHHMKERSRKTHIRYTYNSLSYHNIKWRFVFERN